MTITPTTPTFSLGTAFPSSPIDGTIAPHNSEVFSPTDGVDQFEPSSESGSMNLLPTSSKLETLNFIEGICQDFTIPNDVKIPDRKIIAIFSTIAAKNALPVKAGNVYQVFEHANMICSLENVIRTLAAGGEVKIKTAVCDDRNELLINPQQTTTFKSFEELIQWDAL